MFINYTRLKVSNFLNPVFGCGAVWMYVALRPFGRMCDIHLQTAKTTKYPPPQTAKTTRYPLPQTAKTTRYPLPQTAKTTKYPLPSDCLD